MWKFIHLPSFCIRMATYEEQVYSVHADFMKLHAGKTAMRQQLKEVCNDLDVGDDEWRDNLVKKEHIRAKWRSDELRLLSSCSERVQRHYKRNKNMVNNQKPYARWVLREVFNGETGEPEFTQRPLIDQYYPILYGEAFDWDEAAADYDYE